MAERLKLRAEDEDDLRTLSVVLQDAVVALEDMVFLPEEHRFLLVANRFCWERVGTRREGPFERVHAGLTFEHVRRATRRGLETAAKGNFLELLTISRQDNTVLLQFAGDGDVRLEVERLSCRLEDFDDPWPTRWCPRHAD